MQMDKLDMILEKLGSIDQGFSEMQEDFSKIQKDFGNMQKDMQMQDTRQPELNQMVSSIRDNQLAQRAEQEELVHDVAEIKGEIRSINTKPENISIKMDQLVESQDRQDKILESLSLRSLEQETEIRELKRIK
jgi:chromosome segregation ATPase